MKAGKTISQLATEVSNLRRVVRDYRLPQKFLRMETDGTLKTNRDLCATDLEPKPTDLMHDQIAERLGVPIKYYNRMRAEAPALLANNVNEWIARGNGTKRFLRTYDHANLQDGNFPRVPLSGRAFLGDSYRPLDNYDMMEAVVPALLDSGLTVKSSEVTDTRLYIQLVTDKLTARVVTPHVHHKIDDVLQLGLVVSNSEVGCGSLSIKVLVYRLVCTNGLIVENDMPGFKQVHIGRDFSRDIEGLLSDDTRKLRDAAIWSQARDVIKAGVSQVTLDKVMERINGIAAVRLPNPEKAVEVVAEKFDLTVDERTGVMANLIAGGDVSQWGLTNAVTALANDTASYDRAIDLETIGGKIAGLPGNIFGAN